MFERLAEHLLRLAPREADEDTTRDRWAIIEHVSREVTPDQRVQRSRCCIAMVAA
ncbi:MAG: hypothetical protein ABI867_29615 [Kofleriaceae bacterium]